MRTDGPTGGKPDKTKLIVAFRNFADALKNYTDPKTLALRNSFFWSIMKRRKLKMV